MSGSSLERLSASEIREDGLLIRHEMLENGIRMTIVEALKPDEAGFERAKPSDQFTPEANLQNGPEHLVEGLIKADGALTPEVHQLIMETCRGMKASVRGIHKTDQSLQDLPEDGIIYFSGRYEQIGDAESQADFLIRQISQYVE